MTSRLYLDCPFEEKDEAKKLGASWDATERKWYVPSNIDSVSSFNRWLPRIYLDCSFGEKDEVKSLGAKWDAPVKRWYVPRNVSTSKFKKWLTSSNKKAGRDAVAPSLSPNKSKAALPRVTSDMTVTQLREECLARDPGIKGISSKKKEWFLDHLKVGSVWITAGTSAAEKKNKPVLENRNTESESSSSVKSKAKTKLAPSAATKRSGESKASTSTGNKKAKKDAVPEKKPGSSSSSSLHLATLPRVSTSMSRDQLSCELLSRNPDTKGLSNKNKDWFLEALGAGSIWMTAPECQSIDFTGIPTITSSMTLAQLSAECLARNPGMKGLSNKSKDFFLSHLGRGSVCMSMAVSVSKPPAGVPTEKKTAPPSSSKASASKAPKNDTCAIKKKSASAKPPAAPSTKKKISPIKTKSPVKKPSTKSEKPTNTAKKSSEKVTATVATEPKPATVESNMNMAQKPASKATKPTKLVATKMARKSGPKPSAVKKEKMVRTQDGLPAISSFLTVAQLKEEVRVRDPSFKGLSKMKSADLIAHLEAGTAWESHPEVIQARNCEAELLHNVHCSNAHCHPLADSSKLRCIPKFGTHKKRVDVATCDCTRHFSNWCEQTPYLSCEKCDFDICRGCFKLESLDHTEKEAELDRRYTKMVEREAAFQRQCEETYRAERERELRQERQRKEEFERRNASFLKRFSQKIQKPSPQHLSAKKKLKFTVWTSCGYDADGWHSYAGPPMKEFNSSFDTIEEANQRVEYVFYFENPWGSDFDEMHSDVDTISQKGFRRLEVAPDDSERWTVSVLPSGVLDYLEDEGSDHETKSALESADMATRVYHNQFRFPDPCEREDALKRLGQNIRKPSPQHLSAKKKLKFTVWTSCGYDADGWHSYEGPPMKEFNSSFDTIEEANQRAEYVFYFENPWGSNFYDMHCDVDTISQKGFRRLEMEQGDSERWTVSVAPSEVFVYLNE